MKIIPIKVEDGILKIPQGLNIPPDTQLSVLLTKKDEVDISAIEGNESFSFLVKEPDIYSDEDILDNRKNEKFSN